MPGPKLGITWAVSRGTHKKEPITQATHKLHLNATHKPAQTRNSLTDIMNNENDGMGFSMTPCFLAISKKAMYDLYKQLIHRKQDRSFPKN